MEEKEEPFQFLHDNKITPPTLDLELNVASDDVEDDSDEVEPIIFHPALHDEKTSNKNLASVSLERKPAPSTDRELETKPTPQSSEVNTLVHLERSKPKQTQKKTKDSALMTYQYVERVSSNQEDKKDVPNLTKDIAEIELDNALYDKPVSTSSSSAMSTGTPSSLGDSGSSDSSLLGKLEDCVKTLREDHELRVIGDPALQVELSPSKNHFTATTDIKVKKTTRIDLREKETAFPLHKTVAQRYGSSLESNPGDDLDEQRNKIKEESLAIIRSREKELRSFGTSTDNSCCPQPKIGMARMALRPSIHSSAKYEMTSEARQQAVDCMLAKVDEIRMSISDPGCQIDSTGLITPNGDVKPVYDTFMNTSLRPNGERDAYDDVMDDKMEIDEEVEYVQNYVTFDQSTGESSSLMNTESQNSGTGTKSKKSALKTTKTSTRSDAEVTTTSKTEPKNVTFTTSRGTSTDSFADLLKETNSFKEELMKSEKKDMNKNFKALKGVNRELNFVDKKNQSNKQALTNKPPADVCLACSYDKVGETPLKHDQQFCQKIETSLTNGLVNGDKENLLSTSIADPSPQAPTTTSKSAKKKKRKKNKAAAANATNDVAPPGTSSSTTAQTPDTPSPLSETNQKLPHMNSTSVPDSSSLPSSQHNEELQKEINKIVKELEEMTNQKVLLHKDVSFGKPYNALPPSIDKEFLLLKIALESPGVLKGDMRNSTFDETNSNNFIGLVTLFIFLMHGNALKYNYPSLDIPFDVVSLFQCQIDDELYLIAGVCENDKTYKQKHKRSKLGSQFFHAVSNFLNNNTLDRLLNRINPTTPVSFLAPETNTTKLSSIINIMPDGTALNKLLSTTESITIQSNSKSLRNLNDLNLKVLPSLEPVDQEATCIMLENITIMPPKLISAVLKNLYNQSLEVVGLKLGYMPQASNPNNVRAVLAICIQDYRVSSSEQGHLLFNSRTPELKDLTISFQSAEDEQRPSNKPLLRYTLNSNRAFKQVVQWFGPHFTDLQDLKEHVEKLKTDMKKNTTNNNKKKKWGGADNPLKIAYACNFTNHAVVLVSSLVPSWFLPHVISNSKRKGITLQSISKNSVTIETLQAVGIPESVVEYYGHSPTSWKKASRKAKEVGSYTYLVFKGNSCVPRLNALMNNFVNYLQKGESESSLHQTFDNAQALRVLQQRKRGGSTTLRRRFDDKLTDNTLDKSECFTVLQMNDKTSQLSPSYPTVQRSDLHDLRSEIATTCKIPNVSLAAIVVYGEELQAQFSNLFRLLCFGGPNGLLVDSLIGVKLIENLSTEDVQELSPDECGTTNYANNSKHLLNRSALLLIVKTLDFLCTSKLRTTIDNFLNTSAKGRKESNGISMHSDAMHIINLMFAFFHPSELRHDLKSNSQLVSHVYIEDTHPFLTILDKIFQLKMKQTILTEKSGCVTHPQGLCASYKKFVPKKTVYLVQPQSMNYPCELLLREQISYAGVSIRYNRDHVLAILKAVSRIIRVGFRIVAWKFPLHENGVEYLRIVFCRSDALFFMNKFMDELETNFQQLTFEVTRSSTDLIMFVKNNFRKDAPSNSCGGIFHVNYFSLVNEFYFVKDELFETRSRRSMEWHPMNSSIGRNSFTRQRHMPYSTTVGDSTLEVSVLLLTNPLMIGHFAGNSLPRSCVFPELLQTFDETNYTCLASRLTSLSEANVDEVLDMYNVTDTKKRSIMKTLLTCPLRPFMVLVLIGSCIQSTFWLQIEKMHSEEEDVNILKKFTLITSSKKQVEHLAPAFFDHVLPNSKIEIHTALSELMDVESQLNI
uniref:Uncharacterized protein n=1 Tax=Clytia hemisphaerica TaxID=252671 RepID=A0A7M5U3L8_9CNID